MHLHILGICGTFMGGLALIARAAGHRVTGCDTGVYPPMSTQLREQGIDLIEGFGPEQLDLAADLYVVGNVVARGNPLMEAILDRGLPYVSGPQWLGEHVLAGQHVLAVAGTHGKTTTSAMLAWILECSGRRPNYLVGGVAPGLGVSARFDPAQPYFVIEADEYDTAFFDKRSKFVHYRPRTAILNNLEYDHADIFPDLAAIETQFHHLVRTIPQSGRIIRPTLSPALDRVLARGSWTPVQCFGEATDPTEGVVPAMSERGGATQAGQPGLTSATWRAGEPDPSGHFEVFFADAPAGRIQWSLTGAHNQMNALAALAAADHVGVPASEAITALSTFAGVKRRMEIRGVVNGVTVIDDFAHHPTAIATTLAGLRRQVGAARVIAVIEPRSNTMKLGAMASRLPQALADADRVFCFGAHAGKHALGWDPAVVLAPLGDAASSHADLEAMVDAICEASRPGDHIIVMSNGGFGGIHDKLLASLARRAAQAT